MFVLGPSGSANPPSGAFTPAQIEQGYEFNQISFNGVTGNGSGETIAVVDAYDDPNIQSDLNAFDTEFGLPAMTVERVNQSGGMTYPAEDSTGDWELEESLDVEWAHAMAPSASIMLVEASSDDDTDLLTAVAYAAAHANIVSMSWGSSEFSDESQDDPDFDLPGVVFVASAGDDGAPASWPSASPNVLSVGGTALTLNAQNDWSSEVGWSGSGGGPSVYEAQPGYQTGVVQQTTSARATADVAYDASVSTGFAVYDSIPYNGTTNDWIEVGGTSAGTPQWSALLAIADQGRAQNDQPALDSTSAQQVMTILYQNTEDFHDITTGVSTGSPHYSAGPGYDYVTGLGTPMASLVVSSLDGASLSSVDTLVLTAPTDETAGTPFSLTVTAENASGATDTDYSGTIALSSSDVQAGLPPEFPFSPSDDGTYTFTVTLKTAGSQSITAKDTTNSAVTGTLAGIDVSPAAASNLDLSNVSSSTTAGVSQTVTVTAVDPYGNVATGYQGAIEFTSTDPLAALPASYSFSSSDAGTHSFLVTLETAGTQSITATDSAISSITGTESGVKVQAAAANTLGVSGFATDDTAGTAGTVIVTAYDAYGNVATGYTGTVAFTSTDPHAVLPSSYTFNGSDAGKHSFAIRLDTAGSQSITATDQAEQSITGVESGIMVQAAEAKTLAITGFPTSDTAGTAGTLTVTAYDAYGNVANGYTGTVALSSSDPQAVLPSSYTFSGSDGGDHSFSVTLDTSGLQTITAEDTANSRLRTAETGIIVQAAGATTLTINGFPTTDTAGTSGTVTVTAFDAFGNVATGYIGTVSLTSSAPNAELPPPYTFDAANAGRQTFSVTLDVSGMQSITVADTSSSSLSASETGIAVQAAPAKTFAIGGFPSVIMASASHAVTVTAYDAYGNVATGYTGTVLLTSSDPLAVLASSYTFTALDAGSHQFAVALATAGAQSITATDAANLSVSGSETGITVRAIPVVTWSSPASIGYGTPLSSAQLDASANVPGTFTFTPAAGSILNAGTAQTLSVVFEPKNSTDYTTGSATTTIAVTQATPTLAVTGGSSMYGEPVSLIATLAASGAPPSSGTVTFYDGDAPLATIPVGGTGTATFMTSDLAVGSHAITAAYSGDTDFAGVRSTAYSVTVAPISTEVVLVQTAIRRGRKLTSVRLDVIITPASGEDLGLLPTGEVTLEMPKKSKRKFKVVTTLGSVPLSGGTARLTLNASKVEKKSITVVYSGDTDHGPSSLFMSRLI